MRSYEWFNDALSLLKSHWRWNSCQRTDFSSCFCAQFLYVFFKSKFIINFYSQMFITASNWELLLTNFNLMSFLLLRRRCNLSGFTFTQSSWNYKARLSAALLISLISSNSPLPIANGMLSSTKLTNSVFGINRKRPRRKTLKRSWSKTEPSVAKHIISFYFRFRWLK